MNNNTDYDYIKYLKYKNKYFRLKHKNKIIQIFGGNKTCNKNQLIKPEDLSSALDYVKNKYNCLNIKTKTKNKYFVILYGPPASGKTLARKIACDFIKKNFQETLTLEEILNTFIDTSIDDIVYDVEYEKNVSLKTHLVNLLNKAFEHKSNLDTKSDIDYETSIAKDFTKDFTKDFSKDFSKDNVKEQLKQNIDLYFEYRKNRNIDGISALLAASASYINFNVFFETASPSFDYIRDLINTLFYSNYKIIFIYPYTEDENILIERSKKRGLEEGRIPPAEFITYMKTKCYEQYLYHTDKENTNAIINMNKDIIFVKYNTVLNENLYKSINAYEPLKDEDEKEINLEIIKKK